MADLVLSPALQVIFDRIASPFIEVLGGIWGFEDNLKRIKQSLLMIQAILEDAEEQQVTRKAVKTWLSKLRDAAYDTEDLLEHLTVEGKQYPVPISINAEKVRKALEALEMTANEGLGLSLREDIVIINKYNTRETSSFTFGMEVYGREEDREKIVQQLLSCGATQEGYPTVIPITGIGGIGKTTLAQLAYNDERVTQHFDVKIWVFVSEIFDAKMIMKTVIESATKKICKFKEMDALQSKLWGLLHRKRYLIVLDDAWSEDHDEWDKLRPLFRGGLAGSKIIITSRSKKVALMMDSPIFHYHLKGLDEDDCWALFRQRAFRRGEEEQYPNLLPIGKQIARKFGGMPLAAKTLGSLMRFKREEREWLLVENSELWSLNVNHGGILPSLMLSYYHLPIHLKHCFAFCSVFPKAYEIKKEKLIHLWMAEGFLLGDKPPEDLGNEYFKDLLWMGFFQDAEKSDDGSINGYKMHDIIHDLARYVAGKEFMIVEHDLPARSLVQTRHSSVVGKLGSFTVPEALFEAEHLRTLLLIGVEGLKDIPCKLFSSFKYLRVLDLNSCGLASLDKSIGSLLCLKYLELSCTLIRVLPPSVERLRHLQTLNLYGCVGLAQLPDLATMDDLRHLILTGCDRLPLIPFSIRKLHRLQTLPMYIVDKDYNCIHHLAHLDLCGDLKIKHLQNANVSEAQLTNLCMKKKLETLELHWGHTSARGRRRGVPRPAQQCEQDVYVAEGILEVLQPHQNLKKLLIEGYPGTKFPHWMLPNLIVVNLTNCRKSECLPALGNLLLLKTLYLCRMDGVKCIGKEFYGEDILRPFPSLEELILRGFPNLEEWSTANGGDAFSKLRKLIVDNCPKLTNMPSFQSLQHLELRGCDKTILSIGNLTSLSSLAIERIPEVLSLSGSFLVANTLLTSLKIISCPKLRLLPSELGNLTALISLTIRWCKELVSLPQSLHSLKALESLEISECHSMSCISENGLGGLNSLRTLSIENCNNLTFLSSSLKHLTSLEHLIIMYCPSLGSLPEGLRHLSALRSLTIISCPQFLLLPEELKYFTTLQCLEIHSYPGLTALPEWVGNLTSLRSLTISDCRNLTYLPESLKLLNAFQHLSIQDCPELEERTKQETGEDWPKISHIPHKHIGSPKLGKSTAESSSSG